MAEYTPFGGSTPNAPKKNEKAGSVLPGLYGINQANTQRIQQSVQKNSYQNVQAAMKTNQTTVSGGVNADKKSKSVVNNTLGNTTNASSSEVAAEVKKIEQENAANAADKPGAVQKNPMDALKDFFKELFGDDIDPDKAYTDAIEKSNDTGKAKVGSVKDGDETNIMDKALANDALYGKNDSTVAKYATPGMMLGIGGMPPSYIQNTDPPSDLNPKGVGKFYMDHNLKYGQFIVFRPGFIRWDIGANVIDEIKTNPGAVIGTIAKLFTGRLTRFELQVDTYYFDVERAARLAIYMMGLQDVTLPFTLGGISGGEKANHANDRVGNQMSGDTLKEGKYKLGEMRRAHWRNLGAALANALANRSSSPLLGQPGSDSKTKSSGGHTKQYQDMGIVAFYVNGNIEVSQGLSNSSADNPLKEAVAASGGESNTLGFVLSRLGMSGSNWGEEMLAFFTGNPLMPQVWQASTFDKSYSFSLKFSSHAGDPVSIFLNVIYPLIKIMLLAIPLGVGGFQTSPPILQCFAMGAINTDYGLITNIQINKNLTTMNYLGQPTEVDVQISLGDLNPYLYKERPGWFTKSVELNTGFSNFLATMVGLNVTTIPTDQRKEWEKAMIAIDNYNTGKAMRENFVFGFKNFIDRFFVKGSNWLGNTTGPVKEIKHKLSGFLGGKAPTSQIMDSTSNVSMSAAMRLDR